MDEDGWWLKVVHIIVAPVVVTIDVDDMQADGMYIHHHPALAFYVLYKTGHRPMPCDHGRCERYNCNGFNVARLCEKRNMHLDITGCNGQRWPVASTLCTCGESSARHCSTGSGDNRY
jgi:hypothetical protein